MTKTAQTENTLAGTLANIKAGKSAPCYLIYGDETFLVQDAQQKIIEALVPKADRELNVFILDGDRATAGVIHDMVLTPPLIPGIKAVVIKNPDFLRPAGASSSTLLKAIDLIDSEPERAARQFMIFIRKSGWQLEDLHGDNWKSIPDADWKKVLSSEDFDTRHEWLPRLIALCGQSGSEPAGGLDTFDLEELLQIGIPADNHLILIADTVDRRKGVYKKIAEVGAILDFTKAAQESNQRQIMATLSREALAGSGKTLSPAALRALEKKTGNDLIKMNAEIAKLAAYTGDRSTIDEGDIADLISRAKEDSVFALTAAISERQAPRALSVIQDLLDQGNQPLMILAMIVREIRLITYAKLLLSSGKLTGYRAGMDYPQFQRNLHPIVKQWGQSEGGSPELAKMHPYGLYNTLKNSAGFTLDECLGFMERLLETDLAMKSTGQDAKLLLEGLLIRLCTRAA